MDVRPRLFISAAAILVCLIVLISKTTFDFEPELEGFFVLEGEHGKWLELTNDLVPEDTGRLVWAMPLYPFKKIVRTSHDHNQPGACLDFKWNKTLGRGFIRNIWPDGSKLIVNLGRFKDSLGRAPHGLFVGGGLPPTDSDYQSLNKEATGMAFFNGQRWYHIWCNANEGIISPTSPHLVSYPSEWEFKGSWVRENDGKHLTIESRHSLTFSGIPLESERFLFYTAGNRYVILSITFTNRGSEPLPFQYMYGDEPWIGDFGSSAGDVGWMERELILAEREIDTKGHLYMGMFDYGNESAGENHNFSKYANFLEWEKESRPMKAYISDYSNGIVNPGKTTPLASKENRFIGLQYGPMLLQPGQPYTFTIALGLADNNPKTGFPVKPKTELNP